MADGDLKADISGIKQDVSTILKILKGPEDSDEPQGLIYNVGRNTRFRKNLARVFWIILAANAGVLIMALTIIFQG